MAGKKVTLNTQVLDWAVQNSQLPILEIEHKFKNLSKWLSGEELPTFKQLKDLSKHLRIPFGFMFLKNPPNPDNFKKEFRTINNKINMELSKDLKDVLIDMEFKKNWMSDFRMSQGWNPVSFKMNIQESKYD